MTPFGHDVILKNAVTKNLNFEILNVNLKVIRNKIENLYNLTRFGSSAAKEPT